MSSSTASTSTYSFRFTFVIVIGVLMLAEASRGIVIPTLATYSETLGGSNLFLSFLVSLFSVGRLLASFVFGYFLERISNEEGVSHTSAIVQLLQASLWVVLCGHFFYLLAMEGGLVLLSFARLLTGFGTGVLTIARAFIGDNCVPEEKTWYMSWLGIMQFAGFSFTPSLGGLAVDFNMGAIHISRYTFGSFLLLLVTFVTSGVLYAATHQWIQLVNWKHTIQHVKHQWHQRQTQSEPHHLQSRQSQDIEMDNQQHQNNDYVVMPRSPTTNEETELSATRADHEQEESDLPATVEFISDPVNEGGLDILDHTHSPSQPSRTFIDNDAKEQHVTVSVITVKSTAPSVPPQPTVRYHITLIWLLILMNGVVRGSLAVAETYGTLLYFSVHKQDDDLVADAGTYFLILGVLGVVMFLSVDAISRRLRDDWTLLGSLMVSTVGYGLLMDWDGDLGRNHFNAGMLFIWSIGAPMSQTLTISNLSHLLKSCSQAQGSSSKFSQARYMGYVTAAGSIGRIVIPLIAGASYSSSQTGPTFIFCFIINIIMSVGFAVLRFKMNRAH